VHGVRLAYCVGEAVPDDDVEGADKDYVIVSKLGSPNPKEAAGRSEADGDIEMDEACKVVKLVVPVRKSSESDMKFGAPLFF
jgi:hypothetical protein